MKLRFQFVIISFVLLLVSAIRGQDKSLIEVRSQVDTSTITIGDLIKYSIMIDRDAGLEIAKPGEGLNLGQFEI